jgi:uroporphyrinogen III methyltransferase/synthase
VALYETLPQPLSDADRAAALAADWVTFTAGSAVRSFVEAAGGADALRGGPRLASIGPATSEALRALGLEPDLQAQEHTPAGLIDALVGAASS